MENDYIMKKIKTALQGLTCILKRKNDIDINMDEKSNSIVITEEQLLKLTITKYINEGKINEAENMLFEAISLNKSPEFLQLALLFYEEISEFTEEKLISCNFSKEEIIDGLNSIKKIYDIDTK